MSKGCVIFDFDGVIADTESLHLAGYNHALAAHQKELGIKITLTPAAYFTKYIVYGDREGIAHVLKDHNIPVENAVVEKLAAAKEHFFQKGLGDFAEPLPGVRETLAWLESKNVPRAICSGARREEITMLLDVFKLRHHFDVLVAIEDVKFGKPEPEGYNKAFELLNLEYDAELEKEFSLVIEDSAGGCTAAKNAGLRVLGVATSLPLEQVQRHATFALPNLSHLDYDLLAQWLGIAH